MPADVDSRRAGPRRDASRPAVVESQVSAKRFGDVVALDDVSFDVRRASCSDSIGPDGAGKTTLFRILTTLLLPDAGSATVLGLDVVKDFWAIRARIGYMPGRFSLYPDLSVEENLRFFASVFGTTVEEGVRAHRADLLADRAVRGSPRRRAVRRHEAEARAVLRAGASARAFCLLDEPTTGVDAVSRREFWDLLADAARRRADDRRLDAVHGRGDALRPRRADPAAAAFSTSMTPRSDRRAIRRPLLAIALGERYARCSARCAHTRTRIGVSRSATRCTTPTRARTSMRRAIAAELRRVSRSARASPTPRSSRSKPGIEDVLHGAHERRGGGRMTDAPRETAHRRARLTRRFGTFTAVDHITFDVGRARCSASSARTARARRRRSGCSSACSRRPAATAHVAGFDVATQTRAVKRNIGYMSQRFSLYEDLTVRENITLYGGIYGLTRRRRFATRTKTLVERLGPAHDRRHVAWRALPLGWKQKLAFSVALLHEPKRRLPRRADGRRRSDHAPPVLGADLRDGGAAGRRCS